METKDTTPSLTEEEKERLQEALDDVMDNFDFQNVKGIMDSIGWEWNGTVPDIPRLRQSLRRMIKNTYIKSVTQKCDSFADSGGFYVAVERHRAGLNVLVKFVLTDYETNPNPDDTFTLN